MWSLSTHITDHLIQPRYGDARPPSLWPSNGSAVLLNEYNEPFVTGACRRATWLRYVSDLYTYDPTTYADFATLVADARAVQSAPDKYMRWIWAAGNLFEDFVIEQAKQSGVYLADQVQVVIPFINLVGKLDLLVINPETNGWIAQEIKSIYGHNSTEILGTPGQWNKNKLGKPKDSNLIQIAIYDWHLKKKLPNLESSRLFYGARDTGRFGEFSVKTVLNPTTNETEIIYQTISGENHHSAPVKSPITIDNVVAQYQYILNHVANRTIPPRDYELEFSQERIQVLYERGELGKEKTEAHEKILARIEENKQRIAEGKEPKKELKRIEKGNWQCSNCSFTKFCYNPDNTPRI